MSTGAEPDIPSPGSIIPPDMATTANKSATEGSVEKSLIEEKEGNNSSSTTDIKTGTENDEPPRPTGLKFWAGFATVSFGMFFSGYDSTCVATVTPIITDEFKSLNDVSWYGIAYSLTSCTMILSYGKLYSYFPMKYVFMSALAIFLVGSIVCATAPSSAAFIVGRAISGLGNAGILSGCNIIVSRITTLRERPLYSSIIGGLECVALAFAPLLAGVITEHASWRICFYIIIPFTAISLISTFFFVDVSNTAEQANLPLREKIRQLDLPGMVIFVPLIVCFILALQMGGTTYPWHNARIIVMLVLFGALTLVFAFQQWRAKAMATLSPQVLGERTVTFGMLFMFATSGALWVFSYYTPVFYQAIKGTSTLGSGLRDLPRMLGLVVSLLVAGSVTTWIGYYAPTMILGSVLMAVGAGLTTTWHLTTGIGKIIGYNIIFGLGCGFAFQQPFIAVQTVLPQEDVPSGIVILEFAQFLGSIVALAVSQNVFTNKLMSNLVASVPQIDPLIVLNTGALDLKKSIPAQYSTSVLIAYANALDMTYYVGTALACVTIVGAFGVKWQSVKKEEKEKEKEKEKEEKVADVTKDLEPGSADLKV